MIDEDTQIIFLDEWAERTLQSDMAKLVIRGLYSISSQTREAKDFGQQMTNLYNYQ